MKTKCSRSRMGWLGQVEAAAMVFPYAVQPQEPPLETSAPEEDEPLSMQVFFSHWKCPLFPRKPCLSWAGMITMTWSLLSSGNGSEVLGAYKVEQPSVYTVGNSSTMPIRQFLHV